MIDIKFIDTSSIRIRINNYMTQPNLPFSIPLGIGREKVQF